MISASRQERTVLVTGAGKGIGKATVEHFAQQGWEVLACVRDVADGDSFTTYPSVRVHKMDVTIAKDIQSVFDGIRERNEKIDVVVNNAGIGLYGPFEDITMADAERVYRINVLGLMAVTQAAIKHMRGQGGGTIVNVSSIGGRMNIPYYATYGSTKAAVESFTEGLQQEIAAFGVRLKIVEPGGVATKFFPKAVGRVQVTKQYRRREKKSERLTKKLSFVERPEGVAKVIYKAATSKNNRMRYPTSLFVGVMVFGRRLLPDRLYQLFLRLAFG